ncbi:MAG: hypothetical protein KDD94_00095 [Calditrichaeota bacterium]|nr:hypothetical protein [Calditrichota bacterium]
MAKRFCNTVLLIVLLSACTNQTEFTDQSKLDLVARCWGLYKYYHPTVARGEVNWDSVLVDHLPKLRGSKSPAEFNQQIAALLQIPGDLEPDQRQQNPADSLEQGVHFDWTASALLNGENRKRLTAVLNQLLNFRNKYVSDSVGNRSLGYARFYEDPLPDADMTRVELRLLALFRYWNAINYFYPYKDLTDTNWDDVLSKYIPRFIAAGDKKQYYQEILRLSAEINDGHASIPFHPELRSDFFGPLTVPFSVRFVEDQLIVERIKSDSLADIANVKVGDIIVAIDGVPVDEKRDQLAPFVANPNRPYQLSEISRLILNGSDKTIRLKLNRNGNEFHQDINRYSYAEVRAASHPKPIEQWVVDQQIVQVNMGELTLAKLPELFQATKDSKAMILDFRGYPNWDVMYPFLSYFYTKNQPFALFKSQYLRQPGFYRWHQDERSFAFEELKTDRYTKPVVIIVDEGTLSLGEFFVMAMQQVDQVTVIGSQTAGEDGNQVGFEMPGGIRMFFSSLGIYYPDGSPSQRYGVKIDEPVSLTIDAIRQGNDPLLQRAMELLNKI